MLRMRLRRVGAKKQPRYRVVIAEARTPRDGAFVEIVGYYDPLTEPATVHIDRDKAISWIAKGAQPSDTVARLLRQAGIVEAAASQPTAAAQLVAAGRSAGPSPSAAATEPVAANQPVTAVEADGSAGE